MAIPKPAWTARLPDMKVGEVIIIETAATQRSVQIQLGGAEGRFKTKTWPGGFKIERVA